LIPITDPGRPAYRQPDIHIVDGAKGRGNPRLASQQERNPDRELSSHRSRAQAMGKAGHCLPRNLAIGCGSLIAVR